MLLGLSLVLGSICFLGLNLLVSFAYLVQFATATEGKLQSAIIITMTMVTMTMDATEEKLNFANAKGEK